jgi:hypothetical protein
MNSRKLYGHSCIPPPDDIFMPHRKSYVDILFACSHASLLDLFPMVQVDVPGKHGITAKEIPYPRENLAGIKIVL